MFSERAAIALEWVFAVVIATAVCSTWHGAWTTLDLYMLPQYPVASAIISVLTGSAGLIVLCIPQTSLAAWARAHSGSRVLWLADALYSYLAAWTAVFTWRGVWNLWHAGLGKTAWGGFISHCTGLGVLLLLGAMKNLSAAPMVINSDAVAPIFGASTTHGIGALNPIKRLRTAPVVMEEAAWHRAIGLPYKTVVVEEGPSAGVASQAPV